MNLVEYDRTYRYERSIESPKQSWSYGHQHILNKLMIDKISSPTTKSSPKVTSTENKDFKMTAKSTVGFVPKGFCFEYHNKGKYCPPGKPCSFMHDCPKCGAGVHPAYTCNGIPKISKPFRPQLTSFPYYAGFQPQQQQFAYSYPPPQQVQFGTGFNTNHSMQHHQPQFYSYPQYTQQPLLPTPNRPRFNNHAFTQQQPTNTNYQQQQKSAEASNPDRYQ